MLSINHETGPKAEPDSNIQPSQHNSQKEESSQGQRSIKNATELLELIDSLYRCTSQTREAVMQKITLQDIYS